MLSEELIKIAAESAASALGFFCALFVNARLESRKDRKAYRTMLEAIKVEAASNEAILTDSFLKFYSQPDGVVLRDFFVDTVSQSLVSLVFIKNAKTSELAALGSYLRNIRLANAYRGRSERLRFEEQGKASREWLAGIVEYWGENLKQCELSIKDVLGLPVGGR